VLRTRPLTETSLIVHWLTRDLGRISTVAKGARRAKSPLAGKLDLFYLADLSFQRSRQSELHTLREVSVKNFHAPLRRNMIYLQQASYFVQLIEQSTETETPLPKILELVTGTLRALSESPPRPLTVFAFEAKLLNELGLWPSTARSDLSPGAREVLAKCVSADAGTLSRLRLAPTQVHELTRFLGGFMSYHLGGVPSGRTVALIG